MWLLIIRACSFTYTLGIKVLTMMLPSCANLNYIRINISFFVHDDENFEYLLGDSSYLGEKMFIMKRIGRCAISLNVDHDVINAYNKMHLRYKMWVEWGIGGLKRKYKWLMKMFDSTKLKYVILFKIVIILTNFL